MKNKKFVPLFLLSAMMLTACSNEIIAKPGDYDNPLVVDAGTDALASGVANNAMNVIYDAIRDGSTLSNNLLDEVLHQLAISVLGRYNSKTDDDPVSLKEAAENVDANETINNTVKQFLDSHKSYWIKDSEGERKVDELSRKREYRRVKETWNRIQDRVSEMIYGAIAGGSYNDNLHRFSEEKYLMSLIGSNQNVADPTNPSDIPAGVVLHDKKLILPEIKEEEVFDHFVHQELLENEAKGFNYISKQIVPEIYRELLVEQYLFDQSYNTIGRAYAREVNIVSLTNNPKYPLLAGNLMNAYIDTYINTNDADAIANADIELIAKAWRGIELSDTYTANPTTDAERAANLLFDAGSKNKTHNDSLKGFTTGTYKYWTGTQYGKIIEDLSKVTVDPQTDDTSLHNEFTGSGSVTVENGLSKKINSARLEDYTTDGIFIKNGGLSDIHEDIRTRLFNIGVANALDKNQNAPYPDRFAADGSYSISEEEGNYVCKINGHYYLKPATSERDPSSSDNKLNDFLWFDKTTSTYYIVEVTEAVSSSKLSLVSEKNYENIYGENEGWNKMETISHEVAKVISENDSYKTLSTQYWLKAASIAYHDDVIYDYFVANYPDLFDE